MTPVRQTVKFDKKLLDKDAVKVVQTLIDIATNATPEQVHKTFKRSRIIGRRFRLVHIMFSARKFIEVATFRAGKVKTSNSGVVVRDNFYGSLKDDVFRRDFTVNGLYYDLTKSEVIDYVGGLNDLKASAIKMIGNPKERFEEDPVRMIRAVRFKVKLSAILELELSQDISSNAHLLANIPPARLYEEVIKLFHNENSIEVFNELLNYGLLKYLFSQTKESLFINAALENTSKRIKIGNSVTPAFIFAVFLWSAFNLRVVVTSKKNKSQVEVIINAAEYVIKKQTEQVMMPRWLSTRVKDIWLMQYQLENCNPKKESDLIRNPRFRMAYDFLVLRSQSIDLELESKAEHWTALQN